MEEVERRMKGTASAKRASQKAQQEEPSDLRAVSHPFMVRSVWFF